MFKITELGRDGGSMEPRQSVQGPRKFAQPGLGSELLTVILACSVGGPLPPPAGVR